MANLKVSAELEDGASVTPAIFNDLCDPLVAEFNAWFCKRQEAAGLQPEGLMGVERGAVKAFLLFLSTKPKA